MSRRSSVTTEAFLSKNMTAILKGIAIILMFMHHFFTFPGYYPDTYNPSWSAAVQDLLNAPTKLCVGIFAFITGYVYYYASKKDLTYSLRKIHALLIRYWIVALPLIIAAVCAGLYKFSITGFTQELFGVDAKVMIFAWYVYFYIFIMLLLPLLSLLCQSRSKAVNTLILVFFTVIVLNLLFSLIYMGFKGHTTLLNEVSNLWFYTQITVMGYIFSMTDIMRILRDKLINISPAVRCILFSFLIICAFILNKILYRKAFGIFSAGDFTLIVTFQMDVITAPLLIFGVAGLFSGHEDSLTGKAFRFLGKYSIYMWFWHCLFFGTLGAVAKPVLYAPKFALLILIWGTAVCLMLAWVTDKLIVKITSLRGKKN